MPWHTYRKDLLLKVERMTKDQLCDHLECVWAEMSHPFRKTDYRDLLEREKEIKAEIKKRESYEN